MKRRFAAAMAAAGMALAACGGGGGDGGDAGSTGGADSGQADPEGVLRLGTDLVAPSRGGFTFVPAESGGEGDLGVYHWVYGALLRPTPDGTLEPDLAESTTIVDDTTIEVVLREGLTFSDGSPLDAEAVARSLEHNLTLTDSASFRAGFFSLETVEVTGPTTLVLHIPDGTAGSWHDLFLPGEETVILPEGMDPSTPVGAGPFVVTDHEPEQRVVLEKNPDYWAADEVRLAGIELVNTPDSQTADAALRAGQVDFARIDDYTTVDAAAGAGLATLAEPDPVKLVQVVLCKESEPFSDPQVRRALSHAIDRDAVNEAVYGGEGVAAWGLWPEGHPFYDEGLEGRYAYDPDTARDLLEEAGYGDGFSFDVIPTGSGGTTDVAQVIQQQFAEVGVTMNIVNSANFVDDFYVNRQAEAAVLPVTGESLSRLNQYMGDGVNNTCDYDDPELNERAEQLRTVAGSSDEGVAAWADVQEYVVEEALGIFVVFQPDMYVYDDARIGDVAVAPYVIGVPDIWQLYVEA